MQIDIGTRFSSGSFNKIVDKHRKMYNKFVKYQTDDIKNELAEYELAKEDYL